MAKLTDSIQERWDKLVPEQKRKISITLVILGVIACSSIGYMLSHSGKENKPTPKDLNRREIVLDQGMVEESLYAQATKGMDSTKKELDKTSGRVESLEKKMAAMETYVQGNAATLPGLAAGAVPPAPGAVGAAKAPGGVLPPGGSPLAGISGAGAIPPPPVVMPKESQRSVGSKNLGEFLAPPPPGSSSREDGPAEFKPQPSILGNIAMGSNASFGKSDEDDDTKKNSADSEVYLTPSFMRASTLSGIDAPAMGDGKKDPLPIILRVRSVAFLPSGIKANLRGCYLIGECVGNLATERVDVRLLNLSCISKDGQAVIDQKISGFIIDESGRVGMRGEVVSKMGASIARSALAGLFGGIGEAMSQSAVTTTTNADGVVQQVITDTDVKNMARAGVGKGISEAAKDIKDFYMQLARQTVPCISVGNAKPVTAVIKEGTPLKIMNKSMDVADRLETTSNPNAKTKKSTGAVSNTKESKKKELEAVASSEEAE